MQLGPPITAPGIPILDVLMLDDLGMQEPLDHALATPKAVVELVGVQDAQIGVLHRDYQTEFVFFPTGVSGQKERKSGSKLAKKMQLFFSF